MNMAQIMFRLTICRTEAHSVNRKIISKQSVSFRKLSCSDSDVQAGPGNPKLDDVVSLIIRECFFSWTQTLKTLEISPLLYLKSSLVLRAALLASGRREEGQGDPF